MILQLNSVENHFYTLANGPCAQVQESFKVARLGSRQNKFCKAMCGRLSVMSCSHMSLGSGPLVMWFLHHSQAWCVATLSQVLQIHLPPPNPALDPLLRKYPPFPTWPQRPPIDAPPIPQPYFWHISKHFARFLAQHNFSKENSIFRSKVMVRNGRKPHWWEGTTMGGHSRGRPQ